MWKKWAQMGLGATTLLLVVLMSWNTPAMAAPGVSGAVPASALEESVLLPPTAGSDAAPLDLEGLAVNTRGECGTVAAQRLQEGAEPGRERYSCVQEVPASATKSIATTSKMGPTLAASATVWCNAQAVGSWFGHRDGVCIHDSPVATLTTFDQKTGAAVGRTTVYLTQVSTLDPASTTWNEQISLTKITTLGTPTQVNVKLSDTCTSLCAAAATDVFNGAGTLSDGQTLSGTAAFTDSPAVGAQDLTRPSYTLTVTQPGTTPITKDAIYTEPTSTRCDNAPSDDIVEGDDAVASTAAVVSQPKLAAAASALTGGCVIPAITPTFTLSLASDGAAAATYLWAQQKLPDHWGTTAKPLHRYAPNSTAATNKAAQQNNRNAICPRGQWDVLFTGDSCDEFPFAASMESGALLGRTGQDCAEIWPTLGSNGAWTVSYPDAAPTLTENCVRGHVLLGVNTAAGKKLGTFINANRVLNNDPYYLSVTG